MKKGVLLTVLFALTMVLVYSISSDRPRSTAPVVAGFKAPGFELTDLGGRTWKLGEMAGSVVFVNFWATWCKECVEEMPSIQRLYEQTKDNEKFHLLSILYQDDPETARKYMAENSYTFPVLIDPASITAKAYHLTGVPETYIVGTDGMVAKKTIGPAEWDDPEIIKEITTLTAQR
jgi:cytochrome c biogenesis protein CcmG/thiol:disulfide interchange protein DsbE